MAANADSSAASHPVIFKTSTKHVLPPSKYLIPATWGRFQLSQLVNKALSLPTPTPFDFLINGELLHGTIKAWCEERGIQEEETLELEYFESLMPPKHLGSFEGDNWAGSIDCRLPGIFLVGSYDSTAKIYDSSQRLLHTIGGHTGPVTSARWITPDLAAQAKTLVTGSHDGTAMIVEIPSSEGPINDPSPTRLASLHLHSGPISSVTANQAGTHILTSGWDTLLGVFSAEVPEEDEVPEDASLLPRKKRRKVAEKENQPKRKAPVHVLKSHTGKVTQGIFDLSGTKAYSCGFDSTLRTWDVELGICTHTFTAPSRPMTGLAQTADRSRILASSTDRFVAVYDPREAPSITGPPPLLSHPALPSSVSTHPTDSNKVATGAYDGVVRIWDLRSTKSAITTFEVTGQSRESRKNVQPTDRKKKIMSVDWGYEIIGVAGESGFEIWRINDQGEAVQ